MWGGYVHGSLYTPLLPPGGTLANATAQRSAGKGRDWSQLSRRPNEDGWGTRREGVSLWLFGVSSD